MATFTKLRMAYPWDWTAIFLSTGCAIHCFLHPALLLAIPVVGSSLTSSVFENSSIVFTLLISLYAIASGYRQHESYRPFAFAAVGGFLLSWSMLGLDSERQEVYEWIFTLSGCLLLFASHLSNMLYLRHQRPRALLAKQKVLEE